MVSIETVAELESAPEPVSRLYQKNHSFELNLDLYAKKATHCAIGDLP
jgi:hypothetical protein